MDALPQQLVEDILAKGTPEQFKALQTIINYRYYNFLPRETDQRNYDEQAAFVNDKWNGIAVLLGGNGSGKSVSSMFKLARNIHTIPPPCDLAKIFVVSETMDQCSCLFEEHLQHFFQDKHIQKIEWHKRDAKQPRSIIFAPHASNGHRYQVLFRSYEMRRKSLSGFNNVVGWILDEEAPMDIVQELNARIRKYKIPGFRWWTLTPVESHPELEDRFFHNERFPIWKFYRLNTEKNTFLENTDFLDELPIDIRETRRIGAFSNRQNTAIPEFDVTRHVIKDSELPDLSQMEHTRVIDWGFTHQHAVVWFAHDRRADRDYIYAEYAESGKLLAERAEAMKKIPWIDNSPRYQTFCDPEDATAKNEFANLGIHCQLALKEPVTMSVEKTRMRFLNNPDGRPKMQIVESCKNTIRQLRKLRWKKAHAKSLNPKEAPEELVDEDKDCDLPPIFGPGVMRV